MTRAAWQPKSEAPIPQNVSGFLRKCASSITTVQNVGLSFKDALPSRLKRASVMHRLTASASVSESLRNVLRPFNVPREAFRCISRHLATCLVRLGQSSHCLKGSFWRDEITSACTWYLTFKSSLSNFLPKHSAQVWSEWRQRITNN